MRKSLAVLALVAVMAALLPFGAAQGQGTLDSELYVYNWGDYIDPELLTEFEAQFGVKVTYDEYATNEELFAKIQAGAEYDVIFPSDYMAQRMIELGLVQKVDKTNLPNMKNLDPANMDAWYDPKTEYCLPYQWGTTGIAYYDGLERVPDSWAALFNPEQVNYYTEQGGINVLDDQREFLGAALKYLGYSVNEEDPAKLAQARDMILEVIGQYRYINASDYQLTLLPAKEVVISHSWVGSTARAALETATAEKPLGEWKHIQPKEGGIRFQDTMCITSTSKRKATAEAFLNFLMIPENAARTANLTGYLSANLGARDLIMPELKSFYPSSEILEKLEFIRPLSEEGLKLWDQTWTEIRAQ